MGKGVKKVKYRGKVYTYERDYTKEYAERTESQKKNRGVRRKARKKMELKVGKANIRGKDVDHIRGIKGGNGYKNLRVQSKKKNRSRK